MVLTGAIKEGIAIPDKVGIMGRSYGGYATLVGMAMTPGRFACGVDVVGMSNLVTDMNNVPAYWKTPFEVVEAPNWAAVSMKRPAANCCEIAHH